MVVRPEAKRYKYRWYPQCFHSQKVPGALSAREKKLHYYSSGLRGRIKIRKKFVKCRRPNICRGWNIFVCRNIFIARNIFICRYQLRLLTSHVSINVRKRCRMSEMRQLPATSEWCFARRPQIPKVCLINVNLFWKSFEHRHPPDFGIQPSSRASYHEGN